MNEMQSDDGDGIDVSRSFLLVIMPYFIMIALQDAHHWVMKHGNHFYAAYILRCIDNMDHEMQEILINYTQESAENVKNLQGEHERNIQANHVNEANIKMHMNNCASKIGCQIKSEGLAQRQIQSSNNKKLDLILQLQRKILCYQEANFVMNKNNSKMNHMILNLLKEGDCNRSKVEQLFKDMSGSNLSLENCLPSNKSLSLGNNPSCYLNRLMLKMAK